VSFRPALRSELLDIARAALAAVDAGAAVRRVLRVSPRLEVAGVAVPPGRRLWLVALGKAGATMARVVEQVAGDRIAGGLVVTKDGHGLPLEISRVLEAGHPVPDERSEAAARAVLELVRSARSGDVVLLLLSGGASALTACPAAGLDRKDLADTTRVLLGCGADITEVNAVRKHLTELSGGRMAAAAGCGRIEALVISDVPGDALDVIGSGPCAPDPSRFEDALAVLQRRGVQATVPPAVLEHLRRGARGELPETPKPGDAVFDKVRHSIVARNADAVQAAAGAARERGRRPLMLGEVLRGEARDVGRRLGALLRAIEPAGPVCAIAGGETTVTLRGAGRGGRSQELALSAAVELAQAIGHEAAARLALLAFGTDGTDGPTDAAGAFADAGTVARGAAAGADAQALLEANDAYSFFSREGGLFVTGPTGTNVMDLTLALA
jgi:glycerate-2-kinase